MTLPRPFEYRYVRPPDRVDVYRGTLLHESDDLIILTHVVHPSKPVLIGGEVALDRGSPIVWFLFKGRSYDIGRFYLPDGTWTGYYVDITQPLHWSGVDAGSLEPVVDLFLDVWITPDGRHQVLDRDEFEEAAAAGSIDPGQVSGAEAALAEVLAGLASPTFPPEPVTAWAGVHSDIGVAT